MGKKCIEPTDQGICGKATVLETNYCLKHLARGSAGRTKPIIDSAGPHPGWKKTAKKSGAKKSAPRKSTARKIAARKGPAKKSTARRAGSKKSAARRAVAAR